MATRHTFSPDYAVPPGATLKETLEAKGMAQSDLATRTGLTDKTISQIINGVAPLTLDTADKLEMALGIPAQFWNQMELKYREALTRAEATERLEADVEWLREIPLKELIERKHVQPNNDKAAMVRQALAFFGVSNVTAWRAIWAAPVVQYRGGEAQKKYPAKVAAWLRIGELKAEKRTCAPYDVQRFRAALIEIRRFADKDASEWFPAMVKLCAAAGVAVVVVPSIPGASVSGATKWVGKDKAIIILSLKYKTDDHVWFTFFHEAAHVLLHGKKLVFVDDETNKTDEMELEADAFARQILIPPQREGELIGLRGRIEIRSFARSIGVAPGIVVGRLQRDGMSHKFCNDLKVPLQCPQD